MEADTDSLNDDVNDSKLSIEISADAENIFNWDSGLAPLIPPIPSKYAILSSWSSTEAVINDVLTYNWDADVIREAVTCNNVSFWVSWELVNVFKLAVVW